MDISSFRRLVAITGLGLSITAAAPIRASDAPAAKAAPSLDEQVQAIKSDVLSISAELANLEERLLHPATTQVAVFVSIDGEDDPFGLDSARLSIDGEVVAHHVYSFKELEALRKGGVQRIYTGNVRTGAHQLEIELLGRKGDEDVTVVETASFTKAKEPGRVGITIERRATGAPTVSIESW